MKIQMIDLYLFPLADVHCGYGRQQGNILPSLTYIPGRVIRGGLAGWAIRTGKVRGSEDSIFQKLFLADCRNSAISFPFCMSRGLLPVPFSLFEQKGGIRNPRTRLVIEAPKAFTMADDKIVAENLDSPIDFLCREVWPSKIDVTLKPCQGAVDSLERVVPPFETIIDMKAHHDELTGRVGKDGLFAEEVLPSALPSSGSDRQHYQGILAFESNEEVSKVFEPLIYDGFSPSALTGNLLENPDPNRVVFIGHRRVPTVIYASNQREVDTSKESLHDHDEFLQILNNKEFTITFCTDFIPEIDPHFPLNGKMLKEAFSVNTLKKIRVFCRRGSAHGYDVNNNKPIEPRSTLAAGSCGRFQCSFEESDLRKLWARSLLGIGAQTKDGFGRFKINWSFHRIPITTDAGE